MPTEFDMGVVCNSNCSNVATVTPKMTGTYTTNTVIGGETTFDMVTNFGYGPTFKKFNIGRHTFAFGISDDSN